VQCIGEAFGVDMEDPEQKSAYATKAPLLSVFEVAVKAQERIKVRNFKTFLLFIFILCLITLFMN